MNLSTLTLAQLKATAAKYALQVDGDKRLRSTWENAIESAGEFIAAQVDAVKAAAIALAQETFTYDNAVQAANTLNVVTRRVVKFTLKAMWSVFLVSIALVMLLVEASQNRQKVTLIIREGVENRIKRLVLRYRHLELVGRLAFKFTIVQPVLYRRDRVRLIIRNAISN